MDMLKYTSSYENKEIESGRIKTQLDENLVEAIIKKDEFSVNDNTQSDLKTKGLAAAKFKKGV